MIFHHKSWLAHDLNFIKIQFSKYIRLQSAVEWNFIEEWIEGWCYIGCIALLPRRVKPSALQTLDHGEHLNSLLFYQRVLGLFHHLLSLQTLYQRLRFIKAGMISLLCCALKENPKKPVITVWLGIPYVSSQAKKGPYKQKWNKKWE